MAMRQAALRTIALPLGSSLSRAGVRTASAVPRTAYPTPSYKTFRTSSLLYRQETGWADKGEIKYGELSKIAKQPSGEITLIDVREPDEVAAGMIPSAVSVPLSQFAEAFDANKGGNFERDFSFPRPSFDSPIVFYCRSGKRSAQAQEIAARNGWKNTRNYTGSWLDWTEHEKKQDSDDA